MTRLGNGRGIAPKDHVRTVVRSLGGRITLAPGPGVGTTFTGTLARSPAPPEA